MPTINASPKNPNIKLEHTAFYLQEETRPWNPYIDSQTGKNLPRRSMINSFGAGGAYANLIIEEFMEELPENEPSITIPQEYLILFSAKTKWSLMKYIEKMQRFLQKNSSAAIADIAQSLQKVHHTLEHKAAIITSSIQDFLEKLNLLQKPDANLTALKIYMSSSIIFDMDDTTALLIQQALKEKDLTQLAQHWISGAAIDFRQLSGKSGICRIDLPKYAFEHNIKFDFNNYMIKNQNESLKASDEFYRILLEKIANDELSEAEFKVAMDLSKG